MKKQKNVIAFGVIGLGRFGFAIAKALACKGEEVLVIDNDENKIKQIRPYTENAFVIQQLDKESLEECGIQNCATVIVGMGTQIDVNILTTLNIINMGVPRVIAKAISFEQGKVLEKLGAEVVYPENDMAVRLANKLTESKVMDFIELSDDYSISEIQLTEKISGLSMMDLNLRKKYNINVIAIIKNGKTIIEIDPNIVLAAEDAIVVIGKNDNIDKLEQALITN